MFSYVQTFYLLTLPKLRILLGIKVEHWHLELPAKRLECNISVYLNYPGCKYSGFQYDIINSVKVGTFQSFTCLKGPLLETNWLTFGSHRSSESDPQSRIKYLEQNREIQ